MGPAHHPSPDRRDAPSPTRRSRMTPTLRQADPVDADAIDRLHREAFGPEEGPVIVQLLRDLRDDPTAEPALSLVAEVDGELVGHVLFTAAGVDASQPAVAARLLAPLAVAEPHRRRGIGGRLIGEGLQQLGASGVDLVFVLGDPGYYTRYGFQPAGTARLHAPRPIPPEHADAWMVRALRPGVIGRVAGHVTCAKAIAHPRYWI